MKLGQNYLYLWHSVNLVPIASVSATCTDERPYRITHHHYEVTWLGVVVSVAVPATTSRRMRCTPVVGPIWSRRKRTWRWVSRREGDAGPS